MCKTEFLRDDLIPLADSRGYRTVYMSFWLFERDLVACLQEGLKASVPRDHCEGMSDIASSDVVGVGQRDLEHLQQGFDQILSGTWI